MKRLVNEYGIATAIEILRRSAATANNGAGGLTAEQLALWTILSQRWPLLGAHLVDEPGVAVALAHEREQLATGAPCARQTTVSAAP